jgi:hypothetical protein
MSERAHNSDRPGDSEAMTPVYVPPEEANGPEQPPVEGVTMAPTPPDERDGEEDFGIRETEMPQDSRES